MPLDKALCSIGTLGGGNHFIEVDQDDGGDHWLIIHSGSRNIGLQVANYHQKKAVEMRPDSPKDLAWLDGDEFHAYVNDMRIMQEYANLNRRAMIREIMHVMGWEEKDRVTTVHNYLDTDHKILRKGAVSAQRGERLLIHLNMRDGTLLCQGKGNSDWNYSAPHGAGRILSRSLARKKLSIEDFRATMDGIFTTSVNKYTLDEAPEAYKNARHIIDAISDTVDIVAMLKPVYNFKATEKPIDKRHRWK